MMRVDCDKWIHGFNQNIRTSKINFPLQNGRSKDRDAYFCTNPKSLKNPLSSRGMKLVARSSSNHGILSSWRKFFSRIDKIRQDTSFFGILGRIIVVVGLYPRDSE